MENVEIIVNGMTCNHCKNTVEQNLKNLQGIRHAEADIKKNRVRFAGDHFNLDDIRKKIESLGYKYGGLVE